MLQPYHMINPDLFTHHAGTTLEIDLSAITDNYHFLQKQVENSHCAAVLKADAYGLGMIEVAKALQKTGCKDFFVAYLDEGVALRHLLDRTHRIYVLNGLIPQNVTPFIHYDLIPVLNDLQQIKQWVNLCKEHHHNYPAAIQFDTGMSRFGIDEGELRQLQHIELSPFQPKLLISHLACADNRQHPANHDQLKNFHHFCQYFPSIPASLSASSGIFLGKEWHFDLVRPGAALYGINPTPDHYNPMRDVIGLYSKIIQVRTIDQGTSVGYGASFIADRKMAVAVISLGYADGFFRSLSNKAFVKHRNHPDVPLPVIGRVSMDCLCIDISGLSHHRVHTGDEIEIIGKNCSLTQIANQAETIEYEILTALGNRYHRIYK